MIRLKGLVFIGFWCYIKEYFELLKKLLIFKKNFLIVYLYKIRIFLFILNKSNY